MPGAPPQLARLTVRCCLADATPVGLPVLWPTGSQPKADQWFEVSGSMGVERHQGGLRSIVVADAIELIPKPERPLEP